MNKPPFDPSKPFTKPDFDPSKPFNKSGGQTSQKQITPGLVYEMMGAAPTPTDLPEYAGTKIAEGLGKRGYPKIGGTLGGLVASSPEIASGGMALEGLFKSPSVLAQAIRSTPRMIGTEMEQGIAKAPGLANEPPIQRGAFSRWAGDIGKGQAPEVKAAFIPQAPASYPKDTASFIRFAKARIKMFGDKLSAQELNDYKRIIGDYFGGGINPSSPIGADLTKLGQEVTPLHNKAIEGREALNRIYGLSKKIHFATNPQFWKKAAPILGLGGTGGAIGTYIMNKLMGR